MTWHKVRCWGCSTVYGAAFCKRFYEEYGSLEYCPRCGHDYLLGYTDASSEVTIR